MNRIALSSILVIALGGCLALDQEDVGSDSQAAKNSPDLAPTGRGIGTLTSWAKGGGGHGGGGGGHTKSNGIVAHGGPVILGTTNVYYIWYGSWNDASERAVLTNFAQNIGGSPYYNINTTYYDPNNNFVSNSVSLAGQTTDAYSHGSSNLADSDILGIVSDAITSGALPTDDNAVYFVLTSADVSKSGFCTSYCGWHTHASINGADIKYSFVGNPESQCPSSCSTQLTTPTGYMGADAMSSIVAHELEEAVTDPDLNAWYDRRGYENADKCAWTFGSTYTTGNGAEANMNLGGTDYLIQQNWVNASGGYCAMSY